MKYIFTTFLISFIGLVGFGQEQVTADNTIIQTKDSLLVSSDEVISDQEELFSKIDTVIVDGKHQRIIQDSTLYALRDYSKAKKVDQLLLEELLHSGLYDTIYKDISNLKYDYVDYIDLPTDTLKARLAKLDQKTPFNIQYNESLESVIKMFLKNKREFLDRKSVV